MKKSLHSLTGIALLIVIWTIIDFIINKGIIVPDPIETIGVLITNLFSKEILIAILQTTWKVLLALWLSILVGWCFGLIIGQSASLYLVARPFLMTIQAVPVVSWLSFVIFFWGFGWKGPVFIAFLSLLPVSIFTTLSGLRNLDQRLIEMARVYRVPRSRVLKDIYLGSLFPFMISILEVSIGQAWKVILVAEYLCGDSGLGAKILDARMAINTTQVWALSIIAILLGVISEYLIRFELEKVAFKWTIG
ncbi:MAG: ABC transporter permease subunit [Leptolinea sp.]|jgi:NitT/TauT family transport system permease protein|nr:ABC transporter permease subunit [Leptolinea sp.]